MAFSAHHPSDPGSWQLFGSLRSKNVGPVEHPVHATTNMSAKRTRPIFLMAFPTCSRKTMRNSVIVSFDPSHRTGAGFQPRSSPERPRFDESPIAVTHSPRLPNSAGMISARLIAALSSIIMRLFGRSLISWWLSKMIFLLDNYDSFTYNLVQRIGEIDPRADIRVERNDQITLEQIEELAPERIIISPGPCSPTEAGLSRARHRAFRSANPGARRLSRPSMPRRCLRRQSRSRSTSDAR